MDFFVCLLKDINLKSLMYMKNSAQNNAVSGPNPEGMPYIPNLGYVD